MFNRFDNPASVADMPVRHLSYNFLVSLNAWLLLFPCDLCCDWTMGTVPLVTSWLDPRNLMTLATYTVLSLLLYSALSRPSDRHSNIVLMVSAFAWFMGISLNFKWIYFILIIRACHSCSFHFCLHQISSFLWDLLSQKGYCTFHQWVFVFWLPMDGLEFTLRASKREP